MNYKNINYCVIIFKKIPSEYYQQIYSISDDMYKTTHISYLDFESNHIISNILTNLYIYIIHTQTHKHYVCIVFIQISKN